MLKNYFKIAWRNLFKQKTLAFINIFGLSTGIACFSLLVLYAINEMSFDRFHKNEKDIFCVYEQRAGSDGSLEYSPSMQMPLGPALKNDFPEVVSYTRIKEPNQESFIKIDGNLTREKLSYADPAFFSIFSFPFKYGNPSTALSELNSLVITDSKALQLFGTENAIGRTIQIKVDDVFQPFIVSGIAEDMPSNSSIRFDLMGSFSFLQTTNFGKRFDNWYTTSFRTYVQLNAGSNLPKDKARLLNFHKTYNKDDENKPEAVRSLTTYGLIPLRSIHTNAIVTEVSHIETINPTTIRIVLGIAAAILLIACINFTTLAIGRSTGRSKEVGIRKVIGAGKKQLIFQFLSESFLLSVVATIAGLLLAQFLLPYFNQLCDRELKFSISAYPEIMWLLAALIASVSLLAGGYPAFLLSGLKSIEVLKSKVRVGGSNLFTRSLVTLQFSLSIGLLISTIIIWQQTKYMISKNPGFDKENVLIVDASQASPDKIYPLFKQSLQNRTDIIGIAASQTTLGEGSNFNEHGFMHEGQHKRVFEYSIDADYIPVMKMQLLAGRNFVDGNSEDSTLSVIINEAMMNDFGWTAENAVGKKITGFTNKLSPVVIGVVKNFNFQSLSAGIQPQLFHRFASQRLQAFAIRIKPGSPAPVIAAVQKAWSAVVPDISLKYSFLDEDLNNYYKSEQRWGNIVGWASSISILLACLGLFGLISLTAVNRIKEISIRKVLGASVGNIVSILSSDFLKFITIALLISSPVAWYLMNKWLQSFAYRIEINWMIFAFAGLTIFLIALLTISFIAIKAAIANPIKALRSE